MSALRFLLILTLIGCADKSGSKVGASGTNGATEAASSETSGDSGSGSASGSHGSGRPALPTGVRPRVVLDGELIAQLKRAATKDTREWQGVKARCEIFASANKSAGYLGLQWLEATLSLSLCWHASGEERYAELAVRYLTAMLDDREVIGDGKGGDNEVRRNSGFPIRAHGVGAALGFDWLYNAKTMTPALRKKIGARLEAWLSWYGKDGYLNDNAFANYFWGYMSSLALAGLALDGEDEAAGQWFARTSELLEKTVIPGFGNQLSGGTWLEGWQYGPLVAVNLSLIVRGFQTSKGIDFSPRFPWFGEMVRAQLHRLHPNRESGYANGTHASKPVAPNSTPLEAAVFFLADSQPAEAAKARFIIKKLLPRAPSKYRWFTLLSSLTGSDQLDPIVGEALSLHLTGPGLTYSRSSWDRRAVWTSLQAGAKIAVDHQHNDQGHFELWRGADALFVDGGDGEAFATINHNTLLIDDAKRTINYSPNQGVWAKDSRTVGYVDDGHSVVVLADLAGAWDPKCALRGCKQRTVKKAIRTYIYLRPNVLVIDDQVSVEKKSDLVTWAAHSRVAPKLRGGHAVVELGSSRADLFALLPTKAKLRAPKEPTSSETHVYRRNGPLGDVWRLEIPGNSGTTKHHFRVWMTAANRGAASRAPTEAVEDSRVTVSGGSGGGKVAVLFADGSGGRAAASANGRLVAVGLEPKKKYAVKISSKGAVCSVAIKAAADGATLASAAGSISLAFKGCELAP